MIQPVESTTQAVRAVFLIDPKGKGMEYWLYGFTTIFLIILGATSAKTGGSSVKKAIFRITIWGTIAMGLSALLGYIFGFNV